MLVLIFKIYLFYLKDRLGWLEEGLLTISYLLVHSPNAQQLGLG